MKKTILLWATLAICTFSYAQTEVFINEIHYDNIGADSDEGVEIAGPAGTDLTGWSLIFYNDSGGTIYDTETLTGIIPNLQNNRGVLWFGHSNIQNDAEGIALVDPYGNVIQFLSYEGVITATDGAALGMISTNIGMFEDGTEVVDYSLQLTGTGSYYENFVWVMPAFHTRETINNSQSFIAEPAILSNYFLSGLNYEYNFGPSSEDTFTVSGTNLSTNNIVLTAPANFEISISSDSGWNSTITLMQSGGVVASTIIYARLKSGLNIGSYSENVVVTSTDAVSKTVVLSGNVAPSIGSIIISEIMKNPEAVTDNLGEFFEVYNTTASDIDMNGWVISDAGGSTHTINLPVVVPSGGYAVFGINSNSATNGGFTVNYEYVSTFGLVNTSDEIILTTSAEFGSVIIDQVYYNDTDFPNNGGESMELHLYKYDAVSNDSGTNWGTATMAYGLGDLGTPGTNNDFGLSLVKNQIEGFRMYPNPVSNGNVYITSHSKEDKIIIIYGINGQLIYKSSVKSKESINISNFNKGIYFVRIIEKGKVATRKLVIK